MWVDKTTSNKTKILNKSKGSKTKRALLQNKTYAYIVEFVGSGGTSLLFNDKRGIPKFFCLIILEILTYVPFMSKDTACDRILKNRKPTQTLQK